MLTVKNKLPRWLGSLWRDLLAFGEISDTMKIEIEITEEEAACLWSNNWGEKTNRPVADIVRDLVQIEVNEFRRHFPNSIPESVQLFRKANS